MGYNEMSEASYNAYLEIMRDERGDEFFNMPGLSFPADDFVSMLLMGCI